MPEASTSSSSLLPPSPVPTLPEPSSPSHTPASYWSGTSPPSRTPSSYSPLSSQRSVPDSLPPSPPGSER
eukprot:5906998-Pleurochrysis_carterae.AAC.1